MKIGDIRISVFGWAINRMGHNDYISLIPGDVILVCSFEMHDEEVCTVIAEGNLGIVACRTLKSCTRTLDDQLILMKAGR